MEDGLAFEYCPKCQLIQATLQSTEGGRTIQRCQVCGSPVEGELALERAEAIDLESLLEPVTVAAEASAAPELVLSQAEGAPGLAIPTRSVPLTVWSVDGATLRGQISLRLNTETHAGPETVQDRLNDSDLFLTLSMPGETPFIFLNKIQLIRVETPEGEGLPDAVDDAAEASIEPVRIQLINGEQLSGIVRIEGPAGKRRLSDFLNTQPAFLVLRGADRLHLLHKRFISRIVPQAA